MVVGVDKGVDPLSGDCDPGGRFQSNVAADKWRNVQRSIRPSVRVVRLPSYAMCFSVDRVLSSRCCLTLLLFCSRLVSCGLAHFIVE